jgi:hypothetical protein
MTMFKSLADESAPDTTGSAKDKEVHGARRVEGSIG